MPNSIRILAPFIQNGDPASMAIQIQTPDIANVGSGVYAPGELGSSFDLNDKTWTIVKLKAADAVTPGQALYWNDVANNIVSGASASSIGGVNAIAGVAQCTVTAGANGALICMQTGGPAQLQTTGAPAAAAKVIGSATSGKFAPIAAGTAATDNVYGTFTGVNVANVSPAIINIPTLP